MAERLLRGAVWVSQLTGLGTGALGLCFWVLGSFMGSFSSRFPFAERWRCLLIAAHWGQSLFLAKRGCVALRSPPPWQLRS